MTQKESQKLPQKKGSEVIPIEPNLAVVKNQQALDTLPEQSKGTVLRVIYGLTKNEETITNLERDCTMQFCLDSPSISSQIQAFGRASVARSLDLLIMRLAIIVNVRHNITDAQIKIVVNDLLELYPNESLEDWVLVFKRMRQGYYGKTYHLLNLATIVEAMKTHLDEKYQLLEKQWNDQKTQKEKDEGEIDIQKAYERLKREGLPQDKKARTVDEIYASVRNDYISKRIKDDKAKSDAQ